MEVVRLVEASLGVSNGPSADTISQVLSNTVNATAALLNAGSTNEGIGQVLLDAAPILIEVATELGIGSFLGAHTPSQRTPLVTTYVRTIVKQHKLISYST